MAERPSLETYLDLIPADCRYRLDDKIDEGGGLVRIARSIRNWQVVANYLLGVDGQDIAAIEHDNSSSLERQQ